MIHHAIFLGRELLFDREHGPAMLGRSDRRLQLVCIATDEEAERLGYRVLWGSIERTNEETLRIYRDQGAPRKKGYVSPHDVRPCRGADGGLFVESGRPPIAVDEAASRIVTRVNAHYVYGRGLHVLLYHAAGTGALHFHAQVPPTGLAIDPTPPFREVAYEETT